MRIQSGKTVEEALNSAAMKEIEELWPKFFRNRSDFNKWLHIKQPALGNKTPRQIINSGRPDAVTILLNNLSLGIPL